MMVCLAEKFSSIFAQDVVLAMHPLLMIRFRFFWFVPWPQCVLIKFPMGSHQFSMGILKFPMCSSICS